MDADLLDLIHEVEEQRQHVQELSEEIHQHTQELCKERTELYHLEQKLKEKRGN